MYKFGLLTICPDVSDLPNDSDMLMMISQSKSWYQALLDLREVG